MNPAYTKTLISLSIASVVVSLTPFVAFYSWIFDLFTHFRVQLLAGQVLLIPLLMMNRRHMCSALVVACAIANGYSLKDYLLPGFQVTPGPARVRLLTANVLGRNGEFDGLIATIESDSPDVVLIQEYRPHAALAFRALSKEYPYALEVPREDSFGIALFSRRPLENAHAFDLLGASAIDARVTVDGMTFRLLGVHLSTPLTSDMTALRQAQLEILSSMAKAAVEPLLIVGDFNLSPYSPYFTSFLEQTGLRDALLGNGPNITWPTFLPILGIPIDNCLVSNSWQIVAFERHPAFGSDHYPITVALR